MPNDASADFFETRMNRLVLGGQFIERPVTAQ
jgi:hypothetical protein